MEALVEFGRGPAFRFSVAVALLGLGRHALLAAWGLHRARQRGGPAALPFWPIVRRTLAALSPVRFLRGNRPIYTAASVLFHAGVIAVPVFASGHVRLWRRAIGLGWPALPVTAADALTILTIGAAAFLLAARAAYPASRGMSRLQDWVLPALIAVAFLSGFALAHPRSNPLDLRLLTLLHVATGDLLLVLTPFTKIAHCALLPFSQLVNEMAWRFVPGAGREVTRTLGKEGQPI